VDYSRADRSAYPLTLGGPLQKGERYARKEEDKEAQRRRTCAQKPKKKLKNPRERSVSS